MIDNNSLFDYEKNEWRNKAIDDWTTYPKFAELKVNDVVVPVKIKEDKYEEEIQILTVQDLLDKLNLVIDKGWIKKDDLVFISLSDEKDDCYPIKNINANSIQFYDFMENDENENEFKEWKGRKAANISFVKPEEKTL